MNRHSPAGFSLIELLVVIAIIGILAALLLPVLGTVKHAANLSVCGSSQRQVYAAFLAYADDNDGMMVRTIYYDPNSTYYYEWWYLLVDYIVMDIQDDNGPGSAERHAINKQKDVLQGCPLRKKDYSGSANDCAYAMNASMGRLGGSPGEITARSVWGNGPPPTVGRDFSLSQITLKSSRVLLMDGVNDIKPRTAIGDFDNGQPKRHRNTASYLMFDGHVANLTPRLGWFGVMDPRVVAAEGR